MLLGGLVVILTVGGLRSSQHGTQSSIQGNNPFSLHGRFPSRLVRYTLVLLTLSGTEIPSFQINKWTSILFYSIKVEASNLPNQGAAPTGAYRAPTPDNRRCYHQSDQRPRWRSMGNKMGTILRVSLTEMSNSFIQTLRQLPRIRVVYIQPLLSPAHKDLSPPTWHRPRLQGPPAVCSRTIAADTLPPPCTASQRRNLLRQPLIRSATRDTDGQTDGWTLCMEERERWDERADVLTGDNGIGAETEMRDRQWWSDGEEVANEHRGGSESETRAGAGGWWRERES